MSKIVAAIVFGYVCGLFSPILLDGRSALSIYFLPKAVRDTPRAALTDEVAAPMSAFLKDQTLESIRISSFLCKAGSAELIKDLGDASFWKELQLTKKADLESWLADNSLFDKGIVNRLSTEELKNLVNIQRNHREFAFILVPNPTEQFFTQEMSATNQLLTIASLSSQSRHAAKTIEATAAPLTK